MTWIDLSPIPDAIKKKQDLKDEALRRRIVQTDKATPVDQAEKDAFLGEHTQRVDRQTVTSKHMVVMGNAQPKSSASETAEKRAEHKARKSESANAVSRLGIAILPNLKDPTGRAEKDEPRWAEFGTSPQDYIKGIKESERTALNTKEYVFYGYFQRIRQRLDRAWIPILRSKLMAFYRAGRQLASDMDHVTKVMVVLNKSGEIVRVEIVSESGAHELDDSAVGAFNQAGPFPNPPKGIADTNGEIQIPWEFVLKT